MKILFHLEQALLLAILAVELVMYYRNCVKRGARLHLGFFAHLELGLYAALLLVMLFSVYGDSYAWLLLLVGLVLGCLLALLPKRMVALGEELLVIGTTPVALGEVTGLDHKGFGLVIHTKVKHYTVYLPINEYSSLRQAFEGQTKNKGGTANGRR